MDLSIIIVNYYSQAKLKNCLAALRAAPPVVISWEIIVVDNASGDDLGFLAERPEIRLVRSPKNRGMGGGNNLGIEAARGRKVLILNPDTIIKGLAINTLYDYLENNPSVGIIGPKLVYPDGTLQSSCARFPSFFMPVLRRTFLGDYFADSRDSFMMNDFDHNSVRAVDWLMGSCLMFRKETIGPKGKTWRPRFDERYFMYFEDTDLCRTAWRNGLKVIYHPEVAVIHDHQRESAKNPWYVALFQDKITWIHIGSWLKYFSKWGLKAPQYQYEKD